MLVLVLYGECLFFFQAALDEFKRMTDFVRTFVVRGGNGMSVS